MAGHIVKLFSIIILILSSVSANTETETIGGAVYNIANYVKKKMQEISNDKLLADLLKPYRSTMKYSEKVQEAWSYVESKMDEIDARFQPVYEDIDPHDCLHDMSGRNMSYINTDTFRLLEFWDEFRPDREILSKCLTSVFKEGSDRLTKLRRQHKTHGCTEFTDIKETVYHVFNHLLIIDLKVLSIMYYDMLFYLPSKPEYAEKFLIPKIGKPHHEWALDYLNTVENLNEIVPKEFDRCNELVEQPEVVDSMVKLKEMISNDWFSLLGIKKN